MPFETVSEREYRPLKVAVSTGARRHDHGGGSAPGSVVGRDRVVVAAGIAGRDGPPAGGQYGGSARHHLRAPLQRAVAGGVEDQGIEGRLVPRADGPTAAGWACCGTSSSAPSRASVTSDASGFATNAGGALPGPARTRRRAPHLLTDHIAWTIVLKQSPGSGRCGWMTPPYASLERHGPGRIAATRLAELVSCVCRTRSSSLTRGG